MKTIIAIVLVVLLIGAPNIARANPNDGNLKGLRNFQVLSDVSDSPCGLKSDDINTEIGYIIANSPRLHIVQNEAVAPRVYANLIAFSDECDVAYVSFDIQVFIAQYGYVVIWGPTGHLFSGTPSNMKSRILAQIDTMVKEFVVGWSAANPSP
jgi:hypothetical protein